MKNPIISVLVIAYNRKEYVNSALRSVINQSLPKDMFETILITNFEVDSHMVELGNIKVVHSDNPSIGAKIVEALQFCRGEIVCFLDDDDEWSPQKLETVQSVFSRYPNLVYYHNNLTFIDQDGKPFTPKGQLASWKDEYSKVNTHFSLYDYKLQANIGSMVSFNSSCISVKKSVLLKFSNYLEEMSRAVDKFFFYAALVSNCTILANTAELTFYRVHDSASSVYRIRDFKAFCAKQAENNEAGFRAFSVIYRMCLEAGAYSLQNELLVPRIWHKFNEDIFSHQTRRIYLEDTREVLKLLLSNRIRSSWLATIFALSFMSMIVPAIPRFLIFHYYVSG